MSYTPVQRSTYIHTQTTTIPVENPSVPVARTTETVQPSFQGQGRRLGRVGTAETRVQRQSEEREAIVRQQMERHAIIGRELRYRALLADLPLAPVPEQFREQRDIWIDDFLALDRRDPEYPVQRQRMLSILIFTVLRPAIQSRTLSSDQEQSLQQFIDLIREILQFSLPAGTSVDRVLLLREIGLREGRTFEFLGGIVERDHAQQRRVLQGQVDGIHQRIERSFEEMRQEILTLIDSRRQSELRARELVAQQAAQVEQLRTTLVARAAQVNAIHNKTAMSPSLRSSLEECQTLIGDL